MNRHPLPVFLQRMKHSTIQNYGGIPGLSSSLLAGISEHGVVRLMECSREHQEPIIPHSHRFGFHCMVLEGEVRNVIWKREHGWGADQYITSILKYTGAPGRYEKIVGTEPHGWACVSRVYVAGQEYSMSANEVHSIFFSKGAVVLFFEGPNESESSILLEPFVNGERVPTFKIEPWMFKKMEVPAAVPPDTVAGGQL